MSNQKKTTGSVLRSNVFDLNRGFVKDAIEKIASLAKTKFLIMIKA